MLTVSPDEPAGQVPIGGWSAAKAIRGSNVAPANPAVPASTARRLRRKSLKLFMSSSQAVDRRRRPPQTYLGRDRSGPRQTCTFERGASPTRMPAFPRQLLVRVDSSKLIAI